MSLLLGLFGMVVVTYWLDACLVSLFLLLIVFFLFSFFGKLGYVGLSWCFGFDLMSLCMVVISCWIVFLMYLSCGDYLVNFGCFYSFVLGLLMLFLYLSFSVVDLFLFYVSFESVLIPTLILIVGWGFQPERLYAGLYMLFYTLFASLPLLLCLIVMYEHFYSMSFFVLGDFVVGDWWVYVLLLAFLVKLPMYFLHLWLPRAHVEAPVSGSMVLAGVLLKLGGYGMFRIYLLVKFWLVSGSAYLLSVGLVGGVVTSLVCVGQVDVKMLVAYSSVVHMSLVLGGLISGSLLGMYGGLVMMLAHGLCSSCLFCLVNVLYERVHSRSVVLISGMIMLYPVLAMWWFLVCVCNMSAPPSFGLLGELMLLSGMVCYSYIMMIPLCFMSFFSALFSLYLFNVVQHGSGWYIWFGGFIFMREYLLFFFHWLPLNVMFIGFNYWSD
uniref:NADH-ubiquinone oxidoreductase chain 4 n=1 Tax=Cryptocellus narino TaxID=1329480 RepID=W5R4N6_9ARAC|nr:NADH dehydrogenase subunit 4 [Cryptocellus narino]AGL11927.1 NADH dehydrogenase subunit 4 [Cryptocellus narino]